MRSVITYLRYSSSQQGTGDADSSRRQNELFQHWLKRNGDAHIVASFEDEARSAFKGKHLTKEFGAMMARIEANEFPEGTILLCEAIDRIGRLEHLKTESLMNRILEHGIEIHTLADNIIYTKEILSADLGVSLIQRVKSYLAHQESKQKSFRVSKKWEQRAKLALSGEQQLTRMVPGWIDPDTRKLNEHAQTVKTIFSLLLAGESLHNIARYLQANKIKSFSRRKDANGFSVHSVRTILTSESTVGTLAASKHNDRPAIPDYYEAAVNVATFNQAQEILSKNRKGRPPASDNPITINLFKGLMRCKCGASVHPTGVKNTYQGVYRCNNAVDGRCEVPTMKRKSFDRWMIENIVGLLERSGDKRYADGIGKGWKLESIKPSQFSLTFYWRTTELTDKQIKANIEKLVTCDWQRKLTPLQEAVAYAQANLDAFKEELRELTAAIA
ncbi:TPA: recombinase family protein [Escherichia coli]|uniref:recombinase family protein n=1 Tax=Escherichia coli TaxID=562 RepID=UPI000DD8CBA5|nr:recombinase family protein [Escherichia coli]HAV9692091.1 recombinase family protein [Escherichia coli]HAW0862521.1 recombinase family protein [Escherichia coli]HAW3656237.1 recombinase family protein [Escherichia coli]HAW7173706.1 recombinase family protein [Escherichia coli]HDT3840665.1 recombinase family protein [Escherichia coli]